MPDLSVLEQMYMPRRLLADEKTSRMVPPLIFIGLLTKKSGNPCRWVFFLISLGSPHVRCTPMGRTCGEPNEIGLAPIRVNLNGPRGVHVRALDEHEMVLA